MESKDSISITEAVRKQFTFSLKDFYSSNIEPWLLIAIGVAEVQHDDFPPLFCFLVCFLQRTFALVTVCTISVSRSYTMEFFFIWSFNKCLYRTFYVRH